MKEELLDIIQSIENCLTLVEMSARLGKIDLAKESVNELSDTVEVLKERIGAADEC